MKIKHIIVMVTTLLFTTGMAFSAEPQPSDTRPVIGIALDAAPLPELLVKHLQLQPGQGIRIENVMKGSAAEEAGLERDDIVIGFDGKDLYDRQALIDAVQKAGVGAEISLQIIHLGQRKTVTLKTKAESASSGWEYAEEPQVEQYFQPGRVFRFAPGNQGWIQMFENQIPGDVRSNINSFFNEIYSFQYNSNGQQYSVTIEGDPNDNASMITINVDNDEYKTTIGELDKIPQKYQEAAKNAIADAKQKRSRSRAFSVPTWPDQFGDNFIMPQPMPTPAPGQSPRLRQQRVPQLRTPNTFPDSFYQGMQEQMNQMQQRFEEMQKRQQQMMDQLNQRQQEQEQQQRQLQQQNNI